MKVVGNTFGNSKINELDWRIGDRCDEDWRTDEKIIALIEKRLNEMDYLYNLHIENKITETQRHRLSWLIKGDSKESYCNGYSHYRIIEVDGTRPWVLVDYDSSVFAKNLNEPDENNFVGWV